MYLSLYRLEVESGRWVKPNAAPFDERKCVVCQKLEDEYHFVLESSLYSELRKMFISKYYWKNPSMFKLIELLNLTNTGCIRKLFCFIFQAIFIVYLYVHGSLADICYPYIKFIVFL